VQLWSKHEEVGFYFPIQIDFSDPAQRKAVPNLLLSTITEQNEEYKQSTAHALTLNAESRI
jgi:hypothetical protein